MQKILIVVVLSLCFAVAKRVWWAVEDEMFPVDETAWAEEADAWVAEDLAGGTVADARHWLQQEGNAIWGGDSQDVQALVDDVYASGAPNVWFTGLEEYEGKTLTASIAIELPASGIAREQIFQREAVFWGSDPTPDVGQKYLAIYLD
ncbi:MAG: hypothetical protein AAF430_13155 [Myxococcota bacterium]